METEILAITQFSANHCCLFIWEKRPFLSSVLLIQLHSKAGLLTPVPLLSIAIKLPLTEERRAWSTCGQAGPCTVRVSGPEECNPILSYTKVFLPCEEALDLDLSTSLLGILSNCFLGMIHLRNTTEVLAMAVAGFPGVLVLTGLGTGMKRF